MKKYRKWAKMKSIIEKFHKPRHFSPWDIVWAYIWTNIWHEICGHGDWIERPVLILKRHWTIHTILPLTTSWLYRDELSWRWLLKRDHHKITSISFSKYNKALKKMVKYDSYVVYNRVNSLDSKRFTRIPLDSNRIPAKLEATEFIEVKWKFLSLY